VARRLTNASSSQPIWGVVFLLLLSLAIAAHIQVWRERLRGYFLFCFPRRLEEGERK